VQDQVMRPFSSRVVGYAVQQMPHEYSAGELQLLFGAAGLVAFHSPESARAARNALPWPSFSIDAHRLAKLSRVHRIVIIPF
jgi:hypothetical protein